MEKLSTVHRHINILKSILNVLVWINVPVFFKYGRPYMTLSENMRDNYSKLKTKYIKFNKTLDYGKCFPNF